MAREKKEKAPTTEKEESVKGVTITYEQAARLFTGIEEAANARVGMGNPEFRTACLMNKAVVKPHIETIKEAQTPSEDYKAYRSKSEELTKRYAVKNEDGTIKRFTLPLGKGEEVIDPEMRGYPLYSDYAKYSKEIDQLDEEYKAVLEEEKNRPQLVEELLKKKIENLYFKSIERKPADIPWNTEEIFIEVGIIR